QRVIAIKETARANAAALKYRLLFYPADINLAQQAYESGNVERARELLLQHTSAAGDSPGFEWYYLWHLLPTEKETMEAPAKGLISVITSPDGHTRVVGAGNK